MNVKRNTTYKREDLATTGIVELHALYKDTPLETTGNTFKIQGKANANRFVLSGQVGDAPPVGTGELKSGHLGLYVSGTDLSKNASLPITSIYKIKNNDIAIAEGGMKLATTGDNAAAKRDSPGGISIYTTYADTTSPYLTEDFNGSEKTLGSYVTETRGGATMSKMYPYLDPWDENVAEALFIGGTQSWLNFVEDDMSTNEVLTHYFSVGHAADVFEGAVETRASAGFKLFIKPANDKKPNGLWKNMIDKREGSQKFTIYPPYWRWDHIKPLIKYANEVTTTTPSSDDAEAEPTASNTIFSSLDFTPPNDTAWSAGSSNPSPWCISDMKLSNEQFDSGGQSLKMYHLWNFAEEGTDASKLNAQDALFGIKGQTNNQFAMASADCIPYPVGLDHAFSSDYTSVAGAAATDVVNLIKPEINIDFSISELAAAPTWAFNTHKSAAPYEALTTTINSTALTMTGTSFADFPSSGYGLIVSGSVGEYFEYESRTDTVLTIASTAKRGLFGTTAATHTAGVLTNIYAANEYMQVKNYCSGSIGSVPVSETYPVGASSAIRSSSYKTLLRNFTVTLSNYSPEEGESLDSFLDRGLSAFYSGSGTDGENNVVGGFTVQRYMGATSDNVGASSNKVTAYPLYTRPSHYIASGNGSLSGVLKGWNGYIWRGMPMMAELGASAFNNTDMTYSAGGTGTINDYPKANIFLNGGARLKQTAMTEGLPDQYYEPSVNLSMNSFINAKIVFDMGARNEISGSNWIEPTGGGAQRVSHANMCKVFFTKGFSNHEQADDGDGDGTEYNISTDKPPSIPIYFPCQTGTSKAWDWTQSPQRWPNIMTVWLTNYRFFADNEVTYSTGSSYDGGTTRSGLTTGTNDAGVLISGYGLRGDFPVETETGGSVKTACAYIDKVELRNFGFETFNNSSQRGMFTLPIGLKSNTVATPMNQRDSSNTMAYPNCLGDNLYVRTAPSYVTFGFEDVATIPNTNGNNKYSWLMWNGFSQINFEPNLRYDLYTLQAWKSMVTGGVGGTDDKFVNYYGGQTMQAGETVSRTASAGWTVPVTKQGLTIDLGAPTGDGSETDKLYFTSGAAMTALGNDALSQKGTSYMCINSNDWAKRENIFVSSRILDIPSFTNVGGHNTIDDIPKNTIVVDNPSIFEVARNETDGPFFMIWKLGQAGTDAEVTGSTKVDGKRSQSLTVKHISNDMVTFNEDLGDLNDVTNLVGLHNLPYLFAGPMKYWVTMQVYGGPRGTNTAGTAGQPYVYGTKGGDRTYDNVAMLGLTSAPAETTTGSTWNESIYHYNSSLEATGGRSGTYGKTWMLDVGPDTNIEVDTDYGFGAFDEEKQTGGELFKTTPYVDTVTYMDINQLAGESSAGDNFKLTLGLDNPQGQQNVEFVNADFSGTDSDILKPHLLWGYHTPTPVITNFRIAPLFNVLESGTNLYELTNQDLRSTKFTWEEQAEDVWYRMLMIDVSGNSIRNKYHNAKFVIKGNEAPTTPAASPVTYVYDYTTTPVSKTALTAGGTGDSVGADVRSVITGRQGYAIQTSAPVNATGQAGASTTITLASTASSTNDFYNGYQIQIVGGAGAGADNDRVITDYVGSTKVATVAAWDGTLGNPDNTSVYCIAPTGTITIGSGTNICLDELDEFTIVLHITPVAADATRSAYLFTYGDDDPGTSDAVYCYIHTDGSIRFVVDGNTLQSVSKVAYDGETPMSIILTYNESAPDGKFSKLYIDGVLEDTIETPVTGPATNGNTVIGGQNIADAHSATNYQGLIEEIIVYNRSYEIPETAGEYIFKAANVHGAHGNASDKIIGTNEYLTHSAKLFVYDYTNIRGTTTQEVGSSKQLGWKVTSI
tara:strand:- start:831 stop:6353 length:5523 start_codon:yes stop_codon:yes gene_type:complete